jgi:uncharacterized protein (TIGR00255 family)
MLKSMTGYGKGDAVSERGRFTVEIRSVNHRYGEISVRMPRGFLALEQEVKRAVSTILKRGKIDVNIQWEENVAAVGLPQIDTAVASGYLSAFKGLALELGIPDNVTLPLLIAQKGVFKDTGAQIDEAEFLPQLLLAVQAAVEAIDAMRKREGEALAKDLMARRKQVAEWAGHIGERAPQVVAEYRLKLKARLDQLLEGVEMDGARLAQEVALMADRCDVTEELVRLSSHFGQFDGALKLSEQVGRKLDFLMQEMNREVNTIGSKSSDAEITALVIQIKAEMEKMREQVQNVE